MRLLQSIFSKKGLIFIAFGHIITDFYGGIFPPLLPLFMSKFNISIGAACLIITFLSFASCMSQPLFGYLYDRSRYKYFLVLGPLVAAFFLSMAGLIPNYYLLLLCVFIGGLGIASYHPQGVIISRSLFKQKASFAIGIFVSGGIVGFGLGSLFGGIIGAKLGLSGTPLFFIFGTVFAYAAYKFAKNMGTENIQVNSGPGNKPCTNPKTVRSVPGKGLSLYKWKLFYLLIITVLIVLIDFIFTVFLPIICADKGFPLIIGGIYVAIFSVAAGAGEIINGYISDIIGRKKMIVLTQLLIIPCILLFTLSSGIITFLIVALTGFLTLSAFPVMIAMAQDILPDNIGTTSGIIIGWSWGISGLLITPIGFLAEKIGTTNTLYLACIIPILVCIMTNFIPVNHHA